jgi:hypothetical protein
MFVATRTGWNGIALMLAGLIFAAFMFFHPANTPAGALDPIWLPSLARCFLAADLPG